MAMMGVVINGKPYMFEAVAIQDRKTKQYDVSLCTVEGEFLVVTKAEWREVSSYEEPDTHIVIERK